MGLFIYYYSWDGSFKVELGNAALRLGGITGLTEIADNGDAGSSGLKFDDPSATLGHSSDALKGHKFLGLDEAACAVGNRRMYTARIGDRKYSHSTDEKGSLILGSARVIDADLHELNNILSLRLIPKSDTTWKRPAEDSRTRLAALLASDYLTDLVVDDGLVQYPAADMDAADYREQRPLNVLEDCALATGYTFFLVLDDERDTKASLYFDDFLRAVTYASTLRLSNVLTDKDSGVEEGVGATGTFPSGPATLTRSPERVYSRVSLPFRKGTAVRTKTSTATAFIERDGTAPNANVKTLSRANRVADRFLNENDTEYDVISTSVDLPAAQVNSIRRGHLLPGKWSHLPGYEDFVDCRVLNRVVRSTPGTNDRYTLDLNLTPLATTIVGGACTVGNAINLSAGATANGYTDGPTTGGTDAHTYVLAPTNAGNVVDGDDFTNSSMNSSTIDTAYTGQTFHRGWVIDFGGDVDVIYIDLRQRTGDPWPDAVEYYDGAAYVTPSSASVSYRTDGAVQVQRWTFNATCNSVRIVCNEWCAGDRPYGTSYTSGRTLCGIDVWGCS